MTLDVNNDFVVKSIARVIITKLSKPRGRFILFEITQRMQDSYKVFKKYYRTHNGGQ